MTNDVHQIEIGIVQSLSIAFRDPITVIVYMAWLMLMSPTLTLFVLVLLPIAGFVIGRIARTLKPTALKGQSKLGMILPSWKKPFQACVSSRRSMQKIRCGSAFAA